MANTSPRHKPVFGNVHPIKIENFDIYLIYRATQEVPIKNIWKKLSFQFLRYVPLNC